MEAKTVWVVWNEQKSVNTRPDLPPGGWPHCQQIQPQGFRWDQDKQCLLIVHQVTLITFTQPKKNLQTAPSANQANPELDNAIRP